MKRLETKHGRHLIYWFSVSMSSVTYLLNKKYGRDADTLRWIWKCHLIGRYQSRGTAAVGLRVLYLGEAELILWVMTWVMYWWEIPQETADSNREIWGKFTKGLFAGGRALKELIRVSAESQHWPESLRGKISPWNRQWSQSSKQKAPACPAEDLALNLLSGCVFVPALVFPPALPPCAHHLCREL